MLSPQDLQSQSVWPYTRSIKQSINGSTNIQIQPAVHQVQNMQLNTVACVAHAAWGATFFLQHDAAKLIIHDAMSMPGVVEKQRHA